MSILADKISEKIDDKEINIPQIQSYEATTHAKYDVLKAIRDFYRKHDSSLTCDDLMFRDLKGENYTFQERKKDEGLKEEEINTYQLLIEELEEKVTKNINHISELKDELKRANNAIIAQIENANYLTFKINKLEE